MAEHLDTIVIGMGPGGEAIAGQLLADGRRVAVVERELIGGECGYYACIPSKVLLRATDLRQETEDAAGFTGPELDWSGLRQYRDQMIRHLDDSAQVEQYRDQGAEVLRGAGRIIGRDPWRVAVAGEERTADNVVLATGSEPVYPPVEGLQDLGPDVLWTNREATTLTTVPERALVIGGSAVGIELSQYLSGLGTAVTVVQRGPRLLPREDPRLCELVGEHFRHEGIGVHLNAQVESVSRDGAQVAATLDTGERVHTDVVVLATGRRPRTGGLGLEEVGVTLEDSALAVDGRCQAAPGLWGIGDVTGVSMFTHVAKYQGRVVAENLLGSERVADYTAVPRVVFAHPEIAAVGYTEAQAREQGFDPVTSETDLTAALARPWTYATDPTGTLGLVADREQGVLVGAWVFAPQASEWIHIAALAIRLGIAVTDLRDSIIQFPTFTEAYLTGLDALDL